MLLRRRVRRIAAWDNITVARGVAGRERVCTSTIYWTGRRPSSSVTYSGHRSHVFWDEITLLGRVPTKMAPLSWLLVAQAFALSDALTVPSSSLGWTRRSAIGGLVATGFVRAAVAEDEDAPAELSPPLPPPPPARMIRIEDRLPLVLRNPL